MAFDFEIKKQWSAEDKASWEKELKIESIIEALVSLEVTEEGKAISTSLKLKYWAGIAYQELLGSISPLKNKTEISQRFYLFEGQAGISVDEAYHSGAERALAIELAQNVRGVKSVQSKGLTY